MKAVVHADPSHSWGQHASEQAYDAGRGLFADIPSFELAESSCVQFAKAWHLFQAYLS